MPAPAPVPDVTRLPRAAFGVAVAAGTLTVASLAVVAVAVWHRGSVPLALTMLLVGAMVVTWIAWIVLWAAQAIVRWLTAVRPSPHGPGRPPRGRGPRSAAFGHAAVAQVDEQSGETVPLGSDLTQPLPPPRQGHAGPGIVYRAGGMGDREENTLDKMIQVQQATQAVVAANQDLISYLGRTGRPVDAGEPSTGPQQPASDNVVPIPTNNRAAFRLGRKFERRRLGLPEDEAN